MDQNKLRRIAGLATLPESVIAEAKKKKMQEPVVVDTDTADELPVIVTKIAKKAEGKTGDELAALINQVYAAGVKDGLSQKDSDGE